MSSLRERLEKQQEEKNEPRCPVGRLLRRLEAEGRTGDLKELEEAFADRDSFEAPVIAKFLNAEYGTSLSSLAVQRHRRTTGSGCQCPKTSTGASS